MSENLPTVECVRELPAGPKMNALVAKFVLGWETAKLNYQGVEEWFVDPRGVLHREPWLDFSNDVAAAWPVFMKTLDPNRTSLRPCGNGADGLWWAVFYDETMVASGRTAPLAICREALLVKLGYVRIMGNEVVISDA